MMKMKPLLIAMLLSVSLGAIAQQVTIDKQSVPLDVVLKEITKQTDYAFNFSQQMVDVKQLVSISVKNVMLTDALDLLFKDSGISYAIDAKSVDLMQKKADVSAKHSVTGSVSDEVGEPIIGATVLVKGTTNGVITDFDGRFVINDVTSTDQIMISYIGYDAYDFSVGTQSNVAVQLKSSTISLDDVVVIGYGIQKRSDITGSVASVKASEITSAPTANTAEALQGRVSGVMVQNSSGSPSGDVTIRIRGANSLTYGNDPLVIVDGVQSGSISSLNPNEVESIEILKDAAALSVYGSRGANGVILVTTKSGKKESKVASIAYNSYVSFDNVSKMLPSMNAASYGKLYDDYYLATQGANFFTPDQLTALGNGTNWQNEIFRTAVSHNHNVSIGGNSDFISYYISGSLLNKEGVIQNSNYRQYTLRSNLKVKANKYLSFGLNASVQAGHSLEGESSGALDAALHWSPTKGVYEEDGTYVQHGGGIGPNDKFNPVAQTLEYVNESDNSTFTITPNAELKITDWLSVSSMFSYRQDAKSVGYFDNAKPYNGPVESTSASLTTSRYRSMQNTNIISFNKDWNGHDVSATAVYEIFSDNYLANTSSSQGVPVNLGYSGLQFGQKILSPWIDKSSSALMSVMGRVNYSYKNRYMASFSDRYDGASQLAEGHKWDNFWAASVGWNIASEAFMQPFQRTFSELKLRGSYGTVGNAAVRPYASQQKFYSSYDPDGNPIISISQIANKNLKWECTTEWNIALDTSLWSNRVNIGVEYYDKVTKDLLMWKKVPDVMGVSSQLTNVGSVSNKGWDFHISGYPVNTAGFKWNTNLTFNYNANEIIALDGLNNEIVADGNADFPGLTGSFVQRVGQPMGTFLGYIYDGVWTSDEASIAAVYGAVPGDARYVDVNNDQKIDSDDITIIGNAQPKYIFGWNNTFSYKGFELNMFWQGVAGNDVYNQNRIKRESFVSGFPVDPAGLNYWTPTNENTNVPGLMGTENVNSSRWVEDGSYFRLKNLSLAYYFPEGLLKKSKVISSAKIYVSASNLWTLTSYSGYDPEASLGKDGEAAGVDRAIYPSVKSYIVGLSIKF